MQQPCVQFTLRTLLVAMAIAAAFFTLWTRSRDEFVLIAILAAGILVFFARRPDVTIERPRQAIRIAIDHIRKLDAAFEPAKHVARAYKRLGLAPWTVDIYASGGAYVIRRVKISRQGRVRSLATFAEDEQIASIAESFPVFTLDRDGAVIDGSVQYEV